ncbi:MAG: hypothetical protein LC790_01455 [Actinobacteria bacterium]|nr:hypothetical protein [Actinomycetota bacterium]
MRARSACDASSKKRRPNPPAVCASTPKSAAVYAPPDANLYALQHPAEIA